MEKQRNHGKVLIARVTVNDDGNLVLEVFPDTEFNKLQEAQAYIKKRLNHADHEGESYAVIRLANIYTVKAVKTVVLEEEGSSFMR